MEYLQGDGKRRLDVLGGLVLAAALFPAAVGTGIISAIDTQSNPIFKQPRLGGQGDKPFNIYKFRTLKASVAEASEYKSYGTFDPRASWLGSLIRQSMMDESLQIYNVLAGDMSIVGPRPLTEQDIERHESAGPRIFGEWHQGISIVKSGLFGESQLHRHHYQKGSPELLKKSMEMDLRYFDKATLKGDIKTIIFAPVDMLRANIGVIKDTGEVPEISKIMDAIEAN